MKKTDKKKIKIYYAPEALWKIIKLVLAHDKEIGWNMVVKPYEDGYKIYDVFVYPQAVTGGTVEVDEGRYSLWKDALADKYPDAEANLFGQGHSHVNFGVLASARDEEQQKDEIEQKGSGFYLFQIWNKRFEIATYFYDLDNHILYEKEDIDLRAEEDQFIQNSRKMLSEKVIPIKSVKEGKEYKEVVNGLI